MLKSLYYNAEQFFYSETDACYVTHVSPNSDSLGLNFLCV